MSVVIAGIRPTGKLHLGNYFSVLHELNTLLQHSSFENKKLMLFVADIHAMSSYQHNLKELPEDIRFVAAAYMAAIASELLPDVTMFVQSQVSYHTDLSAIISNYTNMSWLDHMIQFREKSKTLKREEINVALYTYPILMAADILVYRASQVIVGQDQTQHMEFVQKIAGRMNTVLETEFFPVPKIMPMSNVFISRIQESFEKSLDESVDLSKLNALQDSSKASQNLSDTSLNFHEVAQKIIDRLQMTKEKFAHPRTMPSCMKIMSLQDGTSKMSKSDESDLSRINLDDSDEDIKKKIMSAKTHGEPFPKTIEELEVMPEVYNLVNIYALFDNASLEEVLKKYIGQGYSTFKEELAELIITKTETMRHRLKYYISHPKQIDDYLEAGKKKANSMAKKTLKSLKTAMEISI